MRKESALVLFKPSVLNFFEEYYFKVTTSSYRTLGIVCLHTDTKQCHIFHFTHSGWCRSLGENASNLFCSNVPEEWSFLHFTTCKKPGISWQLILDIIVYDSSTLEWFKPLHLYQDMRKQILAYNIDVNSFHHNKMFIAKRHYNVGWCKPAILQWLRDRQIHKFIKPTQTTLKQEFKSNSC